jgi:hypothetical protein
MRGGPKHGPYFARYWWRDGRRYTSYVRQEDAGLAVAACADRREQERTTRARADQEREAWRVIRTLLREIERDE